MKYIGINRTTLATDYVTVGVNYGLTLTLNAVYAFSTMQRKPIQVESEKYHCNTNENQQSRDLGSDPS